FDKVRGTLYDLPAVTSDTRRRLAQTPYESRIEIVEGDFSTIRFLKATMQSSLRISSTASQPIVFSNFFSAFGMLSLYQRDSCWLISGRTRPIRSPPFQPSWPASFC